MRTRLSGLSILIACSTVLAQEKSELQQILDRLERLELENRRLTSEIQLLREDLAAGRKSPPPAEQTARAPVEEPAGPTLEERVSVQEQRTNEHEQTKVGTSQRLPVTLTGTLLFNAYLNGRASGGRQYPLAASLSDTRSVNGASLRQTILGFRFDGPTIIGNGKVSGSFYTDFYAGSSDSLNHLMRIRVATLGVDWSSRSISFGQEKPIISPREPTSMAQVAYSPLTAAGNLWLWEPQARFEQRFSFGEQSGVRAQLGLMQTDEPPPAARGGAPDFGLASTPGLEARVEFWRAFGEGKRIEIAPGFHNSQTRVASQSIASNLFSLDWLIAPHEKAQITGMFFRGQNAAGVGGLRQGYTIFSRDRIIPVRATGGWGQVSVFGTSRLTFNVYAGLESDRASDLLPGDISRNLAYAANAMYRFGNNILVGLEISQLRTRYVVGGSRLNNHYDLAIGYLF